jgi:hypothetical protein
MYAEFFESPNPFRPLLMEAFRCAALGWDLAPLPLAMSNRVCEPLPLRQTDVGYQPAGMPARHRDAFQGQAAQLNLLPSRGNRPAIGQQDRLLVRGQVQV